MCDIQVLNDGVEEEKKARRSPSPTKGKDEDSAEKKRVQAVLEDFGFGGVKR